MELILFLICEGHLVLFVRPLIPLPWTSDDVSSGFQIQNGPPYSHFAQAYVLQKFVLINGNGVEFLQVRVVVELVPVVGELCQPGDAMLPCMLGEVRIPPGVEGPDVPWEGVDDPPGLPAAPVLVPAAAARFGHDAA